MLLTTPPPGFSLKSEVAGVLPFYNEKLLLLQRIPTHPQGNLWCAPGGTIQPEESPKNAAIRELKEETGIEVDPNSLAYLGQFYVRYPNGDFIFHLFQAHLNESHNIVLSNEHQSSALYFPHELSSLPITPGLDECVQFALSFREL